MNILYHTANEESLVVVLQNGELGPFVIVAIHFNSEGHVSEHAVKVFSPDVHPDDLKYNAKEIAAKANEYELPTDQNVTLDCLPYLLKFLQEHIQASW